MAARRYTLFSDPNRPCAFFFSDAGCRNGNKCKFKHTKDEDEDTKTSSMGSSKGRNKASPASKGRSKELKNGRKSNRTTMKVALKDLESEEESSEDEGGGSVGSGSGDSSTDDDEAQSHGCNRNIEDVSSPSTSDADSGSEEELEKKSNAAKASEAKKKRRREMVKALAEKKKNRTAATTTNRSLSTGTNTNTKSKPKENVEEKHSSTVPAEVSALLAGLPIVSFNGDEQKEERVKSRRAKKEGKREASEKPLEASPKKKRSKMEQQTHASEKTPEASPKKKRSKIEQQTHPKSSESSKCRPGLKVVHYDNKHEKQVASKATKGTKSKNGIGGRKEKKKIIVRESDGDDSESDGYEDEEEENEDDAGEEDAPVLGPLSWETLVKLTKAHALYKTSYDFTNRKDSTWIEAVSSNEEVGRKKNSKTDRLEKASSVPQVLAIDCEMCISEDPLTGVRNSKELVRLSVVGGSKGDTVLLDSLVRPAWPIVDMVSQVHGIEQKQLDGVLFTLRHAQAAMRRLVTKDTILVGHALNNDLQSLKFDHSRVVDTALLYRASNGSTASLRELAVGLLGSEQESPHDSVSDARIAYQCAEYAVVGGALEGKPLPTVDKGISGKHGHGTRHNGKSRKERPSGAENAASTLLVHRLPPDCDAALVAELFEAETSVKPAKVSNPEYGGAGGATGRCFATFTSPGHCDLAFQSMPGRDEDDPTALPAKRVWLQKQSTKPGSRRVHIKIRKMKLS